MMARVFVVMVASLMLVACGTDDPAGESNATASDVGQDTSADVGLDTDEDADSGCVPTTCEEAGFGCGSTDDGCGGTLDCGSCEDGEACLGHEGGATCVCDPETDTELCDAEGAECGEVTATDSCGDERTVQCGDCEGDASCSADNICACEGETEAELCAQVSWAECGEITLDDSCGVERTIECGGCADGEQCNDSNTCECAPKKCGDAGMSCGINEDGCGNEIVCTAGCRDALALGGHHSCVADASGGARCWGRNTDGQLGDATFQERQTPTAVSGLVDKVNALGAGEKHTCAHVGGEIYCWGDSKEKQVGDYSSDQNAPVLVSGFNSMVSSMGSGNFHGCAGMETGGLHCWGRNDWGQLGNDEVTWREPDPLQVVFPTGKEPGFVTKVDGGPLYTCALGNTGTLFCWGENTFGQVGTGQTADDPPAPVEVSGINGTVVDFSAGGWFGNGSGSGAGYSSITGFSCAVFGDGSLWCFGANIIGQLGIGSSDNYKALPTEVTGLSSNAVQVENGGDHACALLDDGTVECWGWNNFGQLGDGTNQESDVPVQVTGLNGPVVDIVAGGFHTCAVLESGELQCWGKNSDGQIGDGTTTDRNVPVTIFP